MINNYFMVKDFIKLIICAFCIFGNISNTEAASLYQEKKCKEIMAKHPVKVDITYDFGDLEYNRNLSSQEIEDIYAKKHPDFKKVGKMQGLTLLRANYSMSMSTSFEKMRGLYSCYYPTKIGIHLSYKDSVMYIDKELREGTCEYERTLRHEYTHLRLGYIGMAMQVMSAQNNIQSLVNDIGPLISMKKREEAETELVNKYKNRFLSVYTAIEQIIKEQNAKIDTIENYKKETKLCISI